MQIAVVTLFPEMFAAIGEYGVTSRAIREGLVTMSCWNPRDFTHDRHRTVDDRPFGGGPGMLMKTAPLQAAINAARESVQSDEADGVGHDNQSSPRVIYLSPQGRRLDQAGAEELAGLDGLVLVCGRYQGIDQRVLDTEIDEEWSIGDYVISGGELAAMVCIDAMTRLIPGALGHQASAMLESFSGGLLECPQYTRPEEIEGDRVPEVLVNGNHREIETWREQQALGRTWQRRPDLLEGVELDARQQALLDEYIAGLEGARRR